MFLLLLRRLTTTTSRRVWELRIHHPMRQGCYAGCSGARGRAAFAQDMEFSTPRLKISPMHLKCAILRMDCFIRARILLYLRLRLWIALRETAKASAIRWYFLVPVFRCRIQILM